MSDILHTLESPWIGVWHTKTICTNWNKKCLPEWHWWENCRKLTGVPHFTLYEPPLQHLYLHQLSIVPLSDAKAPTQKHYTYLWMKQCGSSLAPPLWTFYHHSREYSHQAVAGKNSVNAYTTKQKTLTIFYTTPCTAKPLPRGLNLANLFAHFWNQYKAMTLSKNQYHINCNHTSKTGQTNP